MKRKSILIALALPFIFPFLSLGNVTERLLHYQCKKEDGEVKVTLTERSSDCTLTATGSTKGKGDNPGSGFGSSSGPQKDIDTCTAKLAQDILHYINEGYSCSFFGQMDGDITEKKTKKN